MSFFDLLQTFNQNLFLYGGTFILVLSVLVFIHEWGHYIVARWCGVKVETFSVGFGKELLGFNDHNGTRWKISLVPLGGYVKLFGDTDPASAGHKDTVEDSAGAVRPLTPAERNVAFFAKPVWQRAAIVFAGPAINYIFAVLVMAILFSVNGQPVTPPKAAAVIKGSSADEYGFKPHDMVLSIDGKRIISFEDVRRNVMIALDHEKHFVVERDGKKIDIYAKAQKVEQEDRFGFKNSRGLLGLVSTRNGVDARAIREINGKAYAKGDLDAVLKDLSKRVGKTFTVGTQKGDGLETLTIHPMKEFNTALTDKKSPDYGLLYIGDIKGDVVVKHNPAEAFGAALRETRNVTVGTLEALGQIVMGTRSAKELGGVIRIGALAGDMAQQGVLAVMMFMALLSINLGLINLFPIPLLDGGHLLFYGFEAALGRPVPERIQEYAFRGGMVFLVSLMVFTNLNDIMQLLL